MADRTLTVRLGANVAGFVSAMRTAATASKNFQSAADKYVTSHREGLSTISTGLLGVGAGLTALAGLAVSKFATFDAAMSGVAAATMESASNMALLREAALQAGADTAYTASQAAGAVTELAKAGVSTADILGGGLTGALSLAAAGQMDVADAAEVAATAMVQFGLKGSDVSHISDLLAAGAGKAQGDVTDLAAALKQSGLVASQMGLSVEETTGTLTAFAAAGLLGSDAGTSFRTMLLRMANPSAEAADLMSELGIAAYDAQGDFVGMTDLAGQLDKALSPLPQSQRDAALATIFGSDAIRAANVLYTDGAKGIADWTAAVDDQGYAAEQARIKTDNLKGDLERLGGSIDTALIQSGSGANDVLRQMAQGAESVADAIGGISEPVLSATTIIAGSAGLAALGVGGMMRLVVGVNEAKIAVEGLGISGRVAKASIAGVGGALAIGTVAFAAWAQSAAEADARVRDFMSTLDAYGNTTDSTLRTINSALAENRNNWIENARGKAATSLIDMAQEYGLAVEDLQGYILGEASAVDRVNAATQAYIDAHSSSTTTTAAAKGHTDQLTGALNDQAAGLTAAQREAAQKAIADEAAGLAADGLASSTGGATSALQTYAEQQESGTTTTESYTDALKEMIDAQREAAGIVLSVRDAERNYQDAVDGVAESLQQQVDTLASQYVAQGMGKDAAAERAAAEVALSDKLDITTEAGRNNQAALDDVAESGWDLIDSMRANGASQDELQASMATTRQSFIDASVAMGLSAEDAGALADKLGLIPGNVNVTVAADTAQADADVDAFLWRLSKRNASINVRATLPDLNGAVSGSGRPGVATGGYITGPGSGTSDSIPAWLSNGEFVIKAASVAKYGTGMLHQINAGGYANGGLVTQRPASFSAPAFASPATATTRQVPTVQIGTMVTADPDEAARRLVQRQRNALAAYGVSA